MSHATIIEIKAQCPDVAAVRERLLERSARFVGTDHQTDTYFAAKHGRLKLREGDIENALIFYDRTDDRGPKQSNVSLFHPEPGSSLKDILTRAAGVDVVVRKTREIYFIDNVKIHLDNLKELGDFVEIEAIDEDGSIGVVELRRQCEEFMDLFEIRSRDLCCMSYSDMLRGRPAAR